MDILAFKEAFDAFLIEASCISVGREDLVLDV